MAKKSYTITKKEIGDAIVNYLGIHVEGQIFYPYRISRISLGNILPDEVTLDLEYIPKGTHSVQHNI